MLPRSFPLSALLAIACARDPAPPACIASEIAAIPPGDAPATWAAGLLSTADMLVLGEFHGLVPQITFTAEVARHTQDPLDLAVEILPASRQAELDALVAASDRSPAAWARIIGGKYHPLPLTVAEYDLLVEVVAELRTKGRDIRLVGLAPPCSTLEQPDRDAALNCLQTRDATMARAVLDAVDRGRKVLVLAGFAHADLSNPAMLAGHLQAARPGRVASVLIDGPLLQPEGGDGRWALACGGLFHLLEAEDPRQGLALPLDIPPYDRLDCLPGDPSLARSYTGVVALPPGAGPTALPPEVFAALTDEDLTRWNRFAVELMGEPADVLTRDRDGWARYAIEDTSRYAKLNIQAADWCEHGEVYRSAP